MPKHPLTIVPSLADSYIYVARATLKIICARGEYHSMRGLKIKDLRQIWVLYAAETGNRSQSEIADIIGVGPNAMVAMTDILEKELKLVTRIKDASNRRQHRLKLTAKGQKTIKIWQELVVNTIDDIFRPLDKQERETFKALCMKILEGHSDGVPIPKSH